MTDYERTEWSVIRTDEPEVRALSAELGLSVVTASILAGRGLTSAERAREFLSPSLDRDWPSTASIPGMSEAAERVARAVRDSERIVVFGDFDLDGISSAALALLGLRQLGAHVDATVPHRFREGYGLTPPAIERLLGMKPQLVVTVDTGVSAAAEVAALKEHGVDVVVTDHHEPGDLVPMGIPVANPKLAGADALELAGAGVALALVRAVGELLGEPDAWKDLTDLATLGTVADIVPLTGPNRALVFDGLARMRSAARTGVSALANVSGVEVAEMAAEKIAFSLAPRLNAAGRMADPGLALDLLVETDSTRAAELAVSLDEHNRLRQAAEGDLMDLALAEAERVHREGARVLVLAGEGWHEGVRGIVASRIVSRYGIPALLFCVEDGEAQGSGRSVAGVDLFSAVSSAAPMLTRFGGHAAAVGVTLPAEDLGRFTAELEAWMSAVPADAFVRSVRIDAEVPLDGLSKSLAAELSRLEPFGFGNPRPLLGTRGVFLNARRAVGKRNEHLKFTAYDGVASVPGIMFRCPDIESVLVTESAVDIAYELEVDTWQGTERMQLLARDIRPQRTPDDAPAAALVEDLFTHAEEILARGDYAGIAEADSFHTKLAGVTFEGRQDIIARLTEGTPLRLERQPENPYDPNACALFDPFGDQVGFFNRMLAGALAPYIDAGVEYDVSVTEVTGGAEGESRGVNVLVARHDAVVDDEEAAQAARARREELAALGASELDEHLVRHLIGDRQLHAAQAQALDHLAAGENTLVVMATGRGKSLIFHLHAARLAIARGEASVFVYPLRALVADQAFHLRDTFAELGLTVRTVTGETAPGARDDAFEALGQGLTDVVLTTPEFLVHHAERFAASGRVRFVVVDEAHHVGLARAGHRPAYARLDRALETLGAPLVVAVTATADTATAESIRAVLGTTALVLDPTVRENLVLEDRRGSADKTALVSAIAASGDKVIVYVNSRETTVQLARQLRARVPHLLHAVAFYNGGMTRESRHAVEGAFRDGSVRVVVATSAFGEGVNIPDVRHVVLYHLPFNAVEFNQMCGRVGRDGQSARIHLVFGEKDARINTMILESLAPGRDDLAALYLALKDCAGEGDGSIEVTNADLAVRVKQRRPKTAMNDKGVSAAIGVFRELGLVTSEGTGAYRRLQLMPAPEGKLDLASSVRYAEGLEEMAEFTDFRAWALEAQPDTLLARINRPILPVVEDDPVDSSML
ncbi:MAG: single-stranded-DNA-specific exonuclease RecJ [Actinobacteria bacterium HGW-Actinobacteria-1]|jgi:single-stranded-DNA-specific exonuclease|nr:MAG: single-stranded-DNA-specific exonuclease RecJ [Actinobacteria bacterium HGW-Actinobacteria-1]